MFMTSVLMPVFMSMLVPVSISVVVIVVVVVSAWITNNYYNSIQDLSED